MACTTLYFMKVLSALVLLAGFSSLRGFASSFGLAENDFGKTRDLTVMSSSSSSSATDSIDLETCNRDPFDLEEDEMHVSGDGNRSKTSTSSLIKFLATNTKSTSLLPLPPPSKSLDSFFGRRENIDLLFSADAALSQVDDPSDDLWEMLHHCSSLYQDYPGMTPPDATTPIRFVELANPPMGFIGVTLHSTASVGIQFLPGSSEYSSNSRQQQQQQSNSAFGFPELHFFLLSTNIEARGPAPLVWLFYKLIGKKQGEEGITSSNASRFQTSGFTRVWADAMDDDSSKKRKDKNSKMLVIHNMALLESRLRIPSILLKLMPFSTQHLEQQGSASLQTAVDKDVVPALDRFQAAYTDWLSNK